MKGDLDGILARVAAGEAVTVAMADAVAGPAAKKRKMAEAGGARKKRKPAQLSVTWLVTVILLFNVLSTFVGSNLGVFSIFISYKNSFNLTIFNQRILYSNDSDACCRFSLPQCDKL